MEETKPVQVVMLDGDLTSPIMKNRVGNIGNIAAFPGEFPTPQHLYFISTDLIKKHDYYLESRYEREPFIDEADDSWEDDETDSLFGKNPEGTFKVIATTDPSLGLPAIPAAWIRDVYVPSNGSIKEVRLSMEQYAVNTYGLSHDGEPDIDFRLKLTQDNEVVIVDEPKENICIQTGRPCGVPCLDDCDKLQKEQSLKEFYDHGYIEARVNAEWTDTDMVDFLITYSDRHLNSAKDVLEMYKKLKSK